MEKSMCVKRKSVYVRQEYNLVHAQTSFLFIVTDLSIGSKHFVHGGKSKVVCHTAWAEEFRGC